MFCCTEERPAQVVWVLGMSPYRLTSFGDVMYTVDWKENFAKDQHTGGLRNLSKKLKGCGWEKRRSNRDLKVN